MAQIVNKYGFALNSIAQCKDNVNVENLLTIAKCYTVIHYNETWIFIKSDDGFGCWAEGDRFIEHKEPIVVLPILWQVTFDLLIDIDHFTHGRHTFAQVEAKTQIGAQLAIYAIFELRYGAQCLKIVECIPMGLVV